MTLFGGVAAVWGPVIGAAILVPLAEITECRAGEYPAAASRAWSTARPSSSSCWRRRRGCSGRSATAGSSRLPPAAAAGAVPRSPAPPCDQPHRDGPLLDVDGLSRSFGGLRAVSDVSFTVKDGEILGIIGPNGAGKTTLFNLLNGVLPADAGSATLGGESMLGRKVHQVCRMGVGAHLPGGAQLPAPAAARQRDRRRLRRRTCRTTQRSTRRSALCIASAASPGRHGGRATYQQAAAADGTGPRAGRPAAAAAAGRDAGRASAATNATRCWTCCTAARGRHDHRASSSTRCTRCCASPIVSSCWITARVLAAGMPRDVVENRAVIEAYLGKKWLAQTGCLRSATSPSPMAACAR